MTLEDLQAKAQALKNFSNSPNLQDFKTVVNGFVQSFNNLGRVFNEGFFERQNAFNEIGKAFSSNDGTSLSALQKLGIERQSDGSFSISQKTLEKNFQDNRQGLVGTLAGVADRVSKAIDKQLSNIGLFGKKMENLSPGASASTVAPHHGQLDVQKSYQQRLASQLANAGGYVARNAVATYLNVASF